MNEVDAGLLLLRLFLAGLLLGHGLQKSLGWLGGAGITQTAHIFESWGFRPGRTLVALAATCEVVGAAMVATGLGFQLGCAIVIGTMIVAAAPSAANGLWAQRGGCEVPVMYACIATSLAITGPGSLALDRALDLPDGGWPGAVITVLAGGLAAVPPLLARQRELRSSAPELRPVGAHVPVHTFPAA